MWLFGISAILWTCYNEGMPDFLSAPITNCPWEMMRLMDRNKPGDSPPMELKKIGGILLSREAYRLAFLLVTTSYTVSFFAKASTLCNTLLLAWGGTLFFVDLFTKRILFQSKRCIPLIVFMLLYMGTLLINRHMQPFENGKVLLVTGLELFLLLPYDRNLPMNRIEEQLIRFNRIVVWFSLVFSAAAIVMYLFWINGTVGGVFFGSSGGMLYGFYSGPNTGAALASASLALSLVTCHLTSGRPTRLTLINGVIQLLYLYLSNSRASLYAFVFFLVWYSLFFLKGLRTKVEGMAASGVVFLLAEPVKILLHGLQKGILWVVSIVRFLIREVVFLFDKWFGGPSDGAEAAPPHLTEPVQTSPPDKDIAMGFLNGRAELWRCGGDILRDHPLFGVGSRNLPEVARRYRPIEELPGIDGGGMHNIVMQILVSNGVLGFAALASYALICLVQLIGYFKEHRLSTHSSRTVLLCVCILFLLLVQNMVENTILFSASFHAAIFWSYLGFALFYIDNSRTIKTEVDRTPQA